MGEVWIGAGAIEKALSLSPTNARALYYAALLERRAGHSDAEIADLKEVLRQYPQSRDVLLQLGISYYQQHQDDEAMRVFEALQAVDPDDLAAHYNLSVLYRRMGMTEKAAAQEARFTDKRFDPGAPTYSLDFLRRHPEISNETVLWHMHTDVPPNAVESSVGAQ
jgi:tetratricopeptide (TPR) repeat protein